MVLKHRFSGVFGRVSFERGRNYRVLKPERFICIVLQIQRNCRALKPRLRGLCRQNGLEEDKITWYSNSCCYRSTRFGEEKATWYSNQIFLMCRWISSLEGWLQDSQTSTLRGCAGLMAWRGIELQGSQIFCEGGNGVHAIGKGIELQGAQTTPPSEANKAMFWKRKNCRVLKRVCGCADNVLWFGRR